MSAVPRQPEPAFVEHIAHIVSATLSDILEIDEEIAQMAAEKVAQTVSLQFGGELVYVKKDWQAKARAKHAEIYGKFRGNNVKALAHEYGISTIWCYEIIRRERERYVKERQGDIFD